MWPDLSHYQEDLRLFDYNGNAVGKVALKGPGWFSQPDNGDDPEGDTNPSPGPRL